MYYAVKVGRRPGIYTTWSLAQEQVTGYSGARFKKFSSLAEAQEWLTEAQPQGSEEHVYTDGGYRSGRMSIGVWYGEGDPRNVSRRVTSSKNSNNIAELLAIDAAVTNAHTDSVIFTDSNYAIQALIDDCCHSNQELVTVIRNKLITKQHRLFLRKVPAHEDCYGNNQAHDLATIALY